MGSRQGDGRDDADLGQVLFQAGILTSNALQLIRSFAQRWSIDPFQAVLETHICSESMLARILSQRYGLRRTDIQLGAPPPKRALEVCSRSLARQLGVVPTGISTQAGGSVEIAIYDPTRLSEVRRALGADPSFVVAEKSAIHAAIDTWYDPLT